MEFAHQDESIQRYLDLLFAQSSCSWCMDHNRQLYGKRNPLCGSCRKIDQTIRRYEKRISQLPPRSSREFDQNRYELAVAKRMRELAIEDGLRFGDINSRRLDDLDLELMFVEVSKIAVRRELFDNWATTLGESFSSAQHRLLFFMLSEIVRVYRCKHRRFMAGYSLPNDWYDT